MILKVLEENEGSPVTAVEFPYIEYHQSAQLDVNDMPRGGVSLHRIPSNQRNWRECHASRTHQPVITLERKQIWGRMFHREVARLFNDGARLFRHISIIHQLFSFSFLSCWENWLKSYQYLQWSNWFPYIDTDPWFDFRGFERNVRQIEKYLHCLNEGWTGMLIVNYILL